MLPMPSMPHRPQVPGRGFTLIEMLVTVLVTTILLGVAAPSFTSAIARLRLEGMVNELSVDLQYARSAAIRRQAGVTLATSEDGGFYTINSGELVLKVVILPLGTVLTGNVNVAFDPLRGTASEAQLDASSVLLTPRLRASTNAMGRVQLCSPNGDFAGYGRC
jgi:prepilin-type N-terminal cleavage/methylation domain-containing protein